MRIVQYMVDLQKNIRLYNYVMIVHMHIEKHGVTSRYSNVYGEGEGGGGERERGEGGGGEREGRERENGRERWKKR